MGAGRASVTGSDGKHAFTVNGTTVTLTSQTDVASAVAKANADLGATHAVEAYDSSGSLAFRNKSSGTTNITLGNVAGSKTANTVANGGLFTTAPAAGTAVTTPGAAKTLDELISSINDNASLAGKVKASNDGGKLASRTCRPER